MSKIDRRIHRILDPEEAEAIMAETEADPDADVDADALLEALSEEVNG
ncbi:MAG: hypothetical protein ACOCY7_01385 [Halodesulfurarchaeum sp.]